jgi:hypothetical protein
MYIKAGPIAIGHPGIDVLECLQMISTVLKPKSYFEIGTQTGLTLSKIACDAVCVDPEFRLNVDVLSNKTRLSFFQMTSDRFFVETDLRDIFPAGVDVALLDGLHYFEYLLRDFMNTEKACHALSVILMHDCLPTKPIMAERHLAPQRAWAGDVWKLLPILKKYRPDLRVLMFDCPPTGFVACTQLNPNSNLLGDVYYKILDEFGSKRLDETTMEELWQLYPIVDTKALSQHPYDLTMLL